MVIVTVEVDRGTSLPPLGSNRRSALIGDLMRVVGDALRDPKVQVQLVKKGGKPG